MGIEQPTEFIRFEKAVQLSHESFIDGYIDQTKTMIEQKGSNHDLNKAIKQSDGSLLNPFQQAQRYSASLPYSERPRWIVTCNFREFRIYDMEHPNSEPTVIKLKNLATNYYQLEFLVDKSNQHIEREKRVSLEAGELVGKIYKELYGQYKNQDSDHAQKSINQLSVRLVFCLYAEDAGIFGRKNMFHDYLAQFDARGMRQALIRLFKVLDTKVGDRDLYLADDFPKLSEFPYVNGGMFSVENIEIPPFTDELRDLLLINASDDFDWSQISPTIFGAVFESTLNPDTRRQSGMHYTSVENIHKVIDPLFLNDLKDELNEIKQLKQPATIKKRAQEYQDKLANLTFFDPACGSGNFLTETYLSLRKLENEVIKLIYGDQVQLDVGQMVDVVKVTIQNFYGIEINDFAVSVAKTALWIAESQMLEATKEIVYANWNFLPLKTYTHIHEGNALRMDWNEVIPNNACHYVMGNPPFVGASIMAQDSEQKKEVQETFPELKKNEVQVLDYVTCWYKLAAKFIQGTNISVAFVSTNSITQGQQVPVLWFVLINEYNLHINFAYRTFIWNSEAKDKAHVHCVIIGFSTSDSKEKRIYSSDSYKKVNNINPYLIDAENILVTKVNNPICNVPNMVFGNQPRDGGKFVIDVNEYQEILKKEPNLKKWLFKYVGAVEFLHNKPRWCLWLKHATPSDIKKSKILYSKVAAVKEFREDSKAKTTRGYAKVPNCFAQMTQPEGEDFLILPRVSSQSRKYIPIGFEKAGVIASDAVQLIPHATLYEFGIMESNVHMAWMRTIAGRLKSDYRYSAKIVYNNFPWPSSTEEKKKMIEKTAQAILDARALYPDSSLADLYDPLTMPKELLKAHQDNDRATMAAYGMNVKTTTESDAVSKLFEIYEKLTKKN
ncbi:type II restriction endonuclease [Companilactobacillus nantensis DSM 16982]|uniref:site-specific DNA-methyltransferase (adenine-specific) n=1 Tax=Companilactobacillus nantensis DSM 16982 TaxID=1423774 RepID=A0A0R1WKC0_9LACO|nr:type II restriction endonuclease [Companilactobacillus nantensis DSM 16982]